MTLMDTGPHTSATTESLLWRLPGSMAGAGLS